MYKTIGAWEYFYKCAELHNLFNQAHVQLSFFGLGSQVPDHLDSQVTGSFIGAGNVDLAGIVNIDGNAGSLSNAADIFASGTDDVADFVGLDIRSL